MARPRRGRHARPGLTDLLVLDADGVTKAAAGDRSVQAWLERARELDAGIVVSAITLAEVLRGGSRDARCNRILNTAEVWPVTEAVGRAAARLLGQTGANTTVDAVVAATALAAGDRYGAARCVVLTSDPGDLSVLLADAPAVSVSAV